MKLLPTLGTLLLALPLRQSPPSAPAPPRPVPLTAAQCRCSIELTIKRQANGEPLSDVEIVATFAQRLAIAPADRTAPPPAPPPPITLTAITDNSGHATFSNLAEGSYSIRAQREGYFGPSAAGNASQVFLSVAVGPAPDNTAALLRNLTANAALLQSNGASPSNYVQQPTQHVSITMIEGGVISGRIQDANHRPVSGVRVFPYQFAYQNGQRMLRQTSAAVQTDDLGQFRLYWFPPGEYYLRTMVQPVVAARGGGVNFPAATYYPGTLEALRATPIMIHEGEEFSAADFTLQSGQGVTISGTVTNTLPGRVNPNGLVTHAITSFFLVPRDSTLMEQPQTIPNAAPAAGRGAASPDATVFPFEIRGVPPGTYDFYPIFNDGASPQSGVYTGHIPIEVAAENITGLHSDIQRGVDLKVQVRITGNPPPAAANRPAPPVPLENIRLLFRPSVNLPAQLASAISRLTAPGPDGTLTFVNLPEARYYATNIIGMPVDGYVSEMLQGPHSIMNDGVMTIGKETPDPLEVTIARNGGTVSGILQDSQHKPVAGGRVFLIPDLPRRRNLLLYKSATTLNTGTFTISGIAPGAYELIAWDNIPQGAEQNEEFAGRYDALATRLIVSAGMPLSNIQVTQIPANR